MNSGGLGQPIAGDPGLLIGIAWSTRWQDPDKSVTYAKAAIDQLASQKGSDSNVNLGRAHLALAWQNMWRGHFAESMAAALEVEKHLSETGFPIERAHNYRVLGFLHVSRGRLDLAAHATDRGLALMNSNTEHDRRGGAYVGLLMSRVRIFRQRGDSGRAGLVLGHAEDVATQEDAPMVQQHTARWLIDDGCPDKAEERAERALEDANATRANILLPLIFEVLGEAKSRLGNFNCASACFNKGLRKAEQDGSLRAQAQILRAFSEMERARGNTDTALKLNRRGSDIADRIAYHTLQMRLARNCADLLEDIGDHAAAVAKHKVAWALSDKFRN